MEVDSPRDAEADKCRPESDDDAPTVPVSADVDSVALRDHWPPLTVLVGVGWDLLAFRVHDVLPVLLIDMGLVLLSLRLHCDAEKLSVNVGDTSNDSLSVRDFSDVSQVADVVALCDRDLDTLMSFVMEREALLLWAGVEE